MIIYKIENDNFRFQELDLNVFDFQKYFPDEISTLELHQFAENNLSLAKHWPSMKTGFSPIEGGENLLPDVSCWIGATLLLSPKAHRLLGDVLVPYGEFLPIWIDDKPYQIFNCLTVGTATNGNNHNIEFGQDDVKHKVVFKPNKEFESHLYCSALFKNAIQTFELEGMVFQTVGSS